jgi:O-antigen/teichoic acid export membrane protein
MKFAKQTFTVVFASASAQLIQLAATPLLARIYSPSEFGDLAVFQSLMVAVVTVSCLRYELAIPVAQPGEIRPLAHLALLAVLMTAGATWIALALANATSIKVVPVSLIRFRNEVAGAALLMGLFQLTTFLGIRHGNFAYTGGFKIAQAVLFVGLASVSPHFGLLPLYVSSFIVTVFSIARYRTTLSAEFSPAAIREVATKYREYPFLSMPTALLDSLALAAPILIITNHYSSYETGNYSQVQRMASAPAVLLAMAISQVFLKHAGDVRRSGKPVLPLLVRTMLTLGLISGVVGSLVLTLGSPIFRLLLGSGWRTDATFLALSVLPILIRVTVSPVSTIFVVCDRVLMGTSWQLLHFLVVYTALPILARRLRFDDFLLFIVLCELALYSLYGTLAYIAARSADKVTR